MGAAQLSATDPALQALSIPFERGDIAPAAPGRVLFLGARAGTWLRRHAGTQWLCQQDLRGFADELEQAGFEVGEPHAEARFDTVLLLPPRQREARRAALARAWQHVASAGTLVMAVANHDGARSAQADMERLCGPVAALSKHKCRVCWARPDADHGDAVLGHQWQVLDQLQPAAAGLLSRPGLFAWDRIDPASRLLAEYLDDAVCGRVADLGAGSGYLSVQLVHRCPAVRHMDLYEADARALPAARANLDAACRQRTDSPGFAVHWHDVVTGLTPSFDAIITNPPFHQGRADLPQLGRAFLIAASRALRPNGLLRMVANRHLPYEEVLREHFTGMRKLTEQDGFKVIEARR